MHCFIERLLFIDHSLYVRVFMYMQIADGQKFGVSIRYICDNTRWDMCVCCFAHATMIAGMWLLASAQIYIYAANHILNAIFIMIIVIIFSPQCTRSYSNAHAQLTYLQAIFELYKHLFILFFFSWIMLGTGGKQLAHVYVHILWAYCFYISKNDIFFPSLSPSLSFGCFVRLIYYLLMRTPIFISRTLSFSVKNGFLYSLK